MDSNHAPAYNNLGVLEHRRGNVLQARALFQAAAALAPYLYEPFYNSATLDTQVYEGDNKFTCIVKLNLRTQMCIRLLCFHLIIHTILNIYLYNFCHVYQVYGANELNKCLT